MDTTCAVSCGLADFELRRFRPAGARPDLVARTACRRAALSGRPYGGDCLRSFFRRAHLDADLRRCRLRPKWLPTLQGAPADLRQKLGREYHCFLDSTPDPDRRTIGSQWGVRRLTDEPEPHATVPLARHSTNTSSRRLRIIGRAAIISRPAAIAINVARRKFSSISGPSTKASTSGAGSKSCLTNQ